MPQRAVNFNSLAKPARIAAMDQKKPPPNRAEARKKRQAEALKANLKRRKEAAKAADKTQGTPEDSPRD
jgi:hypothetical protein